MKSVLCNKGIIVSCQALPGEPLYGMNAMVGMAKAALEGGAVGIRTNGIDDIRAIKREVPIPVIGLIKRVIRGSDIYITPTKREVSSIIEAGADIVALDATDREDRMVRFGVLVEEIHRAGKLAMADVSTLQEGIMAERLGADLISTTLSGYTPYSRKLKGPDLQLVAELRAQVKKPVVAEGRIWSPEEAIAAFAAGAEWVVIGSAITRPQLITARYADRAREWSGKQVQPS